jgi:hypothetical protein
MSARDAESGSSTYKGGSGSAGGLGNGGIGGGMGGGGNHGGGMGGGAGRNGGIGNRTGLTTGNRMYGGMAFGRPGGRAMNPGAWGIRPSPRVMQGALNRPARPGLLGNPTPASIPGVNPVPEYAPLTAFRDPMAMYTTLTPPREAPIPPSGLMYGNGGLWPGQATTPQAPARSYYSDLRAYNSAYGPEYAALAGGNRVGIGEWTRNTNQINNVTGYDPGYRADTNMTTRGHTGSWRGYGGWNSLGFN